MKILLINDISVYLELVFLLHFAFLGTSAKVYMKLFGTACTTQPRPFTHEGNFQRNGLDTFIISVNKR